MKKEVKIHFEQKAYEEYLSLVTAVNTNKVSRTNPSYKQLLNSINNTLNKIKFNPYSGNLIPRKYLSNDIINYYGVDKIFRIELIGYWRLIYTLIGKETKIIAFILEYMNHDEYNKRFNYKKR